MKVGQYSYRLRGSGYRIYRCTELDETHEGQEPVRGEQVYYDTEEARKRVYELNGWAYKPKTI